MFGEIPNFSEHFYNNLLLFFIILNFLLKAIKIFTFILFGEYSRFVFL